MFAHRVPVPEPAVLRAPLLGLRRGRGLPRRIRRRSGALRAEADLQERSVQVRVRGLHPGTPPVLRSGGVHGRERRGGLR